MKIKCHDCGAEISATYDPENGPYEEVQANTVGWCERCKAKLDAQFQALKPMTTCTVCGADFSKTQGRQPAGKPETTCYDCWYRPTCDVCNTTFPKGSQELREGICGTCWDTAPEDNDE